MFVVLSNTYLDRLKHDGLFPNWRIRVHCLKYVGIVLEQTCNHKYYVARYAFLMLAVSGFAFGVHALI